MRYIFSAAAYAGLAAAHGYVKSYTVDGTTYPAFHKSLDLDPKYNVKRVDWGYAKGGPPVDNVTAPEITCRSHPLIDPALTAIARAGANITFKWSDWFTNHKGPVLTYMGEIKDGQKPEDVDFFKISEATYDPRTMRWGTDWLIEDNDNYYTSTIPSDVKPGTYIVRHELIALHNALNDDYIKKISGAQIYPQCLKVQVLGDGTATPKDTVKFPGGYKWDDKGILMNLYYGPNEYISPGPAVYKPQMASPPKGPLPVVKETGEVTGPLAAEYKQLRAKQEASFENTVHGDSDNKRGGGGCHWEVGADPSTAKCVAVNPDFPAYAGHAQPKQSPGYLDTEHSNRRLGTGPFVLYLFDPTKPRWGPDTKVSDRY